MHYHVYFTRAANGKRDAFLDLKKGDSLVAKGEMKRSHANVLFACIAARHDQASPDTIRRYVWDIKEYWAGMLAPHGVALELIEGPNGHGIRIPFDIVVQH
jgi:hypothetical protein